MRKYADPWNCKTSAFPEIDFRSRYFKGVWQKHFIDKFVNELITEGNEHALNSCGDDKNEHLPQYLYKFCRPGLYSLINLENGRLWLSSPEHFNDPFDSYIGVSEDAFCIAILAAQIKAADLITDEPTSDSISFSEYWKIRHAYAGHTPNSVRANQRVSDVLRDLRSKKSEAFGSLLITKEWEARQTCRQKLALLRSSAVRVACFSNFANDEDLGNNTTMWSHYAADHTGFCLKYKLDFEDIAQKNELKCGLFPVKYSGSMPQVQPTVLHKALVDERGRLQLNAKLTKTIYKALVTKSAFWNYEKEWRLILNDSSKLISDGNIDFPFLEAIYLGCRIENSLKEHIIAWAKAKHLPVYQAKQHEGRFVLDFTTVSEL